MSVFYFEDVPSSCVKQWYSPGRVTLCLQIHSGCWVLPSGVERARSTAAALIHTNNNKTNEKQTHRKIHHHAVQEGELHLSGTIRHRGF